MRKTIVFITHDLHEALLLGSRIAIMKEGRFVQVSTPQEIVAHPANEYVSSFTRDVDRGRIFSAMDVLQPSATIDRDAKVNVAIGQLEAKGVAHAFVTDADDRPVGFITLADLKIGQKHAAVQDVMERQFPQVLAGSRLVDIYETLAGSGPVAVVDDVGRLLGTVSPTSVFRKIALADGALHS
jgi:glycine betaine/proline transport system ATP-binding protein